MLVRTTVVKVLKKSSLFWLVGLVGGVGCGWPSMQPIPGGPGGDARNLNVCVVELRLEVPEVILSDGVVPADSDGTEWRTAST